MPEVFRSEGYVFFFYANEAHEPMHVHVRRGGGHAKFWLASLALAYAEGLKVREPARAEEPVVAHKDVIRRRWHEVFGS